MANFIDGIVKFPTDAQSNGLMCVLASLFVKTENYTDDTPYFCGRNKTWCTDCNDCGDKTVIKRHHNQMYHRFITLSGVGLMWEDKLINDNYTAEYIFGKYQCDLPDRLDFILKSMGYSYNVYNKEYDKDAIFNEIKLSIDNDIPVIMKLGKGDDWNLVSGYDDNETLYGMDCNDHFNVSVTIKPDGYTENGLFYTPHWYDNLTTVIVITDKSLPKFTIDKYFQRMYDVLSDDVNDLIKIEVFDKIAKIKVDNAYEIAIRLNNLAGYSVESRWHAAECISVDLYTMTQDEKIIDVINDITGSYLNFHDVCWKIWALLGVKPSNNYTVPKNIGDTLVDEKVKNSLISEFTILFNHDMHVNKLIGNLIK